MRFDVLANSDHRPMSLPTSTTQKPPMRPALRHTLALVTCLLPAFSAAAEEISHPPSLKTIPVPQPPELAEFVQNHDAAIVLGKALFWDMAVGSDRSTACASCHGSAGIDPRRLNVVHPGANGTFDGGVLPGEWKGNNFFPTTVFEDPSSRFSTRLRSIDDVAGSQGVLRRYYIENHSKLPVEVCEDDPTPPFGSAEENHRQVTGRNSPTVLNAVFNIRNFWDGRANPWFNGVNGLGPIDGKARVWRMDDDGTLERVRVQLRNASLASQAVMPVLSPVEMSCEGRQLPDLARRLLDERALSLQRVALTDSSLGSLVAPGGVGLTKTYREMIEEAFLPEWHAGELTGDGIPQMEANFSLFFGLALQLYQATLVSDDSRYDRWMEAGGPAAGEEANLLTPQERRGADIFINVGQLSHVPIGYCIACHSTPLFSSATTPVVSLPSPNGIELMTTAATARLAQATFADHPVDDPLTQPLTFALDGAVIELWTRANGTEAGEKAGEEQNDAQRLLASITLPQISTTGCPSDFHTSALVIDEDDNELQEGELLVTIRRRELPTGGCGTTFVVRLERARVGDFEVKLNGETIALPTIVEPSAYDRGFYNIGVRPTAEDLGVGGTQANGIPLSWTRRRQLDLPIPEIDDLAVVPAHAHAAVNGAFKTPGLRNIELTGPYMHNGGQATLRQVMEFYNRGGDFHDQNIADLSPDMNPLQLTSQDMDDVVAFMKTLTDERVRDERMPFDHPELPLPNGSTLPPVGAEGREANCMPPIRSFEELLTSPIEAGDCDGDGVLDACVIETEPWLDVNRDGTLDSCQCLGDIDQNGFVDSGDIAIVLSNWAQSGKQTGADINRDGLVNGDDLVFVLSHWGSCSN